MAATKNHPVAAGLDEMTGHLPFLLTKLRPPRATTTLLQRERLLARLKSIDHCKLAVIEAAAGFGKTTLLAQWNEAPTQEKVLTAWLSLDESDNTPTRFWGYILRALTENGFECSAEIGGMLQGSSPMAGANPVPTLIQDLCSYPDHIYIVLDDFHHIENPEITRQLNVLLDHAPPNFHLLIGSRATPHLALARYHSQGQLIEITGDDLRFNFEEILQHLNEQGTLNLSNADLRKLLELTEGWATGIKLAVISPGMKENPTATIQSFQSGLKYVTRYLKEIVFDQASPDLLDFLVQTSVLDRLSVPLCEALTGKENCLELLEEVIQKHLFLEALDDQDNWYRYHQLFSKALQIQLRRRSKVEITQLHSRASQWFAANHLWAEAIKHSLAAADLESTLKYLEETAFSLISEGEVATLADWLTCLPQLPMAQQIRVQLSSIWAFAHSFRFAEAEQLCAKLTEAIATGELTLNEEQYTEFQVIRAVNAGLQDDSKAARMIMDQVADKFPCKQPLLNWMACSILTFCHLHKGDHEAVREIQHLAPIDTASREEHIYGYVYTRVLMGKSCIHLAIFDGAEFHYQNAFNLATRIKGPESTSAVTAAAPLAEVLYERNQWEHIEPLVLGRREIIEQFSHLDGFEAVYSALIRMNFFSGELINTWVLLERAKQLAIQRNWSRLLAGCNALEIVIRLANGDIIPAKSVLSKLEALAENHTTDEASTHSVIGWHAITSRARIDIIESKWADAITALTSLIQEQERLGNNWQALRTRVLLAKALHLAGKPGEALVTLSPALEIGQKQGLVRVFIDEGPELKPLIESIAKSPSHTTSEFRKYLLDLTLVFAEHPLLKSPSAWDTEAEPDNPKLSARELEILELLSAGKSNKEIARITLISPETVKWHLKNLYGKLNVSNRTQALGRARELFLMA